MRIKILLMAVVLTGLLFSLSASAQDCWTDPITTDPIRVEVPIGVTNLNYQEQIAKFDSNLGQLLSVRLTSQAGGAARCDVDSEDPLDQVWRLIARGGIAITLPNGHEEVVQFGTPVEGELVSTAPDDEPGMWNADFAGPDWDFREYGTLEDPYWADEVEFVYTAADPEFAQFIGTPGDTLLVEIITFGNSAAIGETSASKEERSYAYAGGWVEIEYTYCPKPPAACISGSKIGCEDEPLEGWTITLTKPDGSTDTRITDANGEYSFCNLLPGSYDVCEETRPGWYPVGPTCYNDIILAGDDYIVTPFKNTEHFCISGHKYNVTSGEEPIEGWTITLTKPDGSKVTDTTDANGYYEFCDLANGQYTVSEELKSGWIAKSSTSVDVELYCEDESVDFRNALAPKLVCVCPFIIKNELYTANCKEIKVVDASKGLLANDPAGSVVLNPGSITIDPKYGAIEVHEDGSFVYDPTVATGKLYSGLYLTIKYSANNGFCDSKYLGVAKIQISCR